MVRAVFVRLVIGVAATLSPLLAAACGSDFTLALTGDRSVTSADLIAEGKPVFILFHATW